VRCESRSSVAATFFDVAVTPQTKVAKDILGDDAPYYDVGLSGLAPLKAVVGEVADGYPAKKAGMRKGDLIVSHQRSRGGQLEYDENDHLPKQRGTASVRVVRNGETLTVDIVPVLFSEENVLGEKVDSYRIGISSPGIDIPEADRITIKRGFFQALVEGWIRPIRSPD
jgi:regulator of sigma E protease